MKLSCHNAEEVKKGSNTLEEFPFRASRERKAPLVAQVSRFKTGEIISVALSHESCGTLLLQPWRIDAIKTASDLKSNLRRTLVSPQLFFCLC